MSIQFWRSFDHLMDYARCGSCSAMECTPNEAGMLFSHRFTCKGAAPNPLHAKQAECLLHHAGSRLRNTFLFGSR